MLDVVAAVARQPYEGDDARQRVEFLAVIAEQVTKLRNSLDECDIDLTAEVYTSLLRRHLQTLRIPFEGEPLEGIQIMGILETRNLDFENVIILSMNDDNFPGNHMAQASFIPCNLRAAYELPTPEHHEGVYAYYFYRLIQRAKTVHMLYCSHADDKSTGEPSRYIYQLDYESGFDGGGRQPGRNGADRGAQGRRGDGPAGAFRRRPKPCDALADGVFPLRGLPLALLFPFHSPLGGR